jgi:hypothetical protein
LDADGFDLNPQRCKDFTLHLQGLAYAAPAYFGSWAIVEFRSDCRRSFPDPDRNQDWLWEFQKPARVQLAGDTPTAKKRAATAFYVEEAICFIDGTAFDGLGVKRARQKRSSKT